MGAYPTNTHDEMDASGDDRGARGGGVGVWVAFVVALIASFYFVSSAGVARPRSFAGGGWSTDWKDQMRKSNASGKRALVLFTADWCPACRSFEDEVFARPDVRQYLQDRYTLIVVDCTRNDARTKTITDQYSIEVYPTMILYNRAGTGETARCYGLSAKELVLWLRSEGKAVRQIIEPRGAL
jgi:thiol:disulfide interchange protein